MTLELEGLIARLLLVISCAGEQGMFGNYSTEVITPSAYIQDPRVACFDRS